MQKTTLKLNDEKGFTLVELMVVVAIIGILTMIGVPQYKAFKAKARQTEAKVSLSAIYTAESAYEAEHSAYCATINAIGVDAPGGANNNFYAYGFADAGHTALVTSGGCSAPTGDASNRFGATDRIGAGANAVITDGLNAATFLVNNTANTFLAGAAGFIGGTNADTWTINENKVLDNTRAGLQ